MAAPVKGWMFVLQHVKEHKGLTFEYLLRNQIPSNKAILNEAKDFIDASLNHWHICDSGTAMPQDTATISTSTNTGAKASKPKSTSATRKTKTVKYPRYTAPMLDAIREAIDASDVKTRYADAWNGFTV